MALNILMTGSEGLIGTALQKRLKERGDKIMLSIDKRSGSDIRNIEKIYLKNKIDLCIHLAAFCKINKTIDNPETAFLDNVEGTYKVLEFCRKNNIKKVVFTSSSRILSKEKNPYTASKIYGEELVKAYSQCYGIDYVIIRPSTVYGPHNDFTKRLVDVFILNALQGKELGIFGDGNKTLDFTYIDDFVQGFMLALEQKNKEFDISSGLGTRVEHLADLIIKLAGKGEKKFYPAEIAQPQEVELDISAIKSLGYKTTVNIEEGITKTFNWYKENLNEILLQRIMK
ncbi:MAG: NAD-dependent epimerase/dehydratase family protein [Nanoarchaeota archaeon]|nr:NAD-dependent epimerase/dehydratase family protein [Nanoarchaeota archaeon]